MTFSRNMYHLVKIAFSTLKTESFVSGFQVLRTHQTVRRQMLEETR